MQGQYPLMLSDLGLGDHLVWLSRNKDDSNAIKQRYLEIGAARDEKPLHLTIRAIDQMGLTSLDDLTGYFRTQTDLALQENYHGMRAVIEVSGFSSECMGSLSVCDCFTRLEQQLSTLSVLTLWMVEIDALDSKQITEILLSQNRLGIGEKIYANPYRIMFQAAEENKLSSELRYHHLVKVLSNENHILTSLMPNGYAVDRIVHKEDDQFSKETLFRSIFEAASLGVVILGLDGRILECNPAFQEMIGFNVVELLERDLAGFCHPEDGCVSTELLDALSVQGRTTYKAEGRFIAKDGHWTRGRVTASLLKGRSEAPKAILMLVEDITTRWQLESELMEVQRRLMQNREMERLRLAQDLHDTLLQEFYGLVFNLKDLMDMVKDQAILVKLTTLEEMLQLQIQELRTFCNELRPPTLAPFGLEKAIRSYTQNFRMTHPNIKFYLDLMADGQQLPEPVRLVLFRIYQELLSNIARHSGADAVSVIFHIHPDQITLAVEDNGRGFALPDRWISLVRQGHFGLVGAHERAETVGGRLTIQSKPDSGTRVIVTVPIENDHETQTNGELHEHSTNP